MAQRLWQKRLVINCSYLRSNAEASSEAGVKVFGLTSVRKIPIDIITDLLVPSEASRRCTPELFLASG